MIHVVRVHTATSQVRDGDLDCDGVHVEPLRAVHADRVRRRDEVQVLERAQRPEIEDAAEVDVEALGSLPGEDAPVVADVVTAAAVKVLA